LSKQWKDYFLSIGVSEDKITILNNPLAVINVLMGFAHIQITYNLISNMSSINFTLNLALFTTYISVICFYISYRLYKDKEI
jgi:hypothetical protein